MATEKNYDKHLRLASRDNSVAGNELGEDITGSLDNDHECATKPPFRQLALLQASLNSLFLALSGAEGDLATHREVGTNVWCDGP